MRPTVEDVRPVSDDHFVAIERSLGIAIPQSLRTVVREVNGGSPSPRDVPCETYSGESSVQVYEFARWDQPREYVDMCRTYHNEIGVPRRYLVLATTDADTFFVDLEHAGLRVMYFEYVEGGYESHFGDGEMDCAGASLDAFMGSFFDGDSESDE
jgi:SMI1 / KNR4 family (SUKH-1)